MSDTPVRSRMKDFPVAKVAALWQQGMKLKEIAEQLHVSLTALGAYVHRMRKIESHLFPYRRPRRKTDAASAAGVDDVTTSAAS